MLGAAEEVAPVVAVVEEAEAEAEAEEAEEEAEVEEVQVVAVTTPHLLEGVEEEGEETVL